MSHSFSDRVIALAALGQALQQVRRIADTGQADAAVVGTALDSVFRVDAPTPAAVFGRTSDVTPGLRLLRSYLIRENQDENLLRLGMSVLQLERRFVRANETVEAVSEGIREIGEKSGQHDHAHPDVIAALGGLYADTISHLRPRVMVQGNPHYLAQPGVVAEIRAVLLAAVRAAVLWRQVGGSYWDFLFSRRAMIEATNELLG